MRSWTLRYFCRSKLFSKLFSWWSVKAVRAFLGFFCFNIPPEESSGDVHEPLFVSMQKHIVKWNSCVKGLYISNPINTWKNIISTSMQMGDYFVKVVDASTILEKLIIKENIFFIIWNFWWIKPLYHFEIAKSKEQNSNII